MTIRKISLAATFAALFLNVSAANAETYYFSQTGFNDGARISGFFQAQDNDQNGYITGNEVFNFGATVQGGTYAGLSFSPSRRFPAFINFRLGGSNIGDDNGEVLDFYSGVHIGYIANQNGGVIYDGFEQISSSISRNYLHIDSISAVPEPQTYALFGIGLAALGLLRKQRRKIN